MTHYLHKENIYLFCLSIIYNFVLFSFLDTPPSSMESLTVSSFQNLSSTIVSPIEDYSDNDLHLYRSEPHITVVDGETRIQDLPPPPDLTSDILLQNEINYQKQKANAQGKGVRLQVEEDEDDNPSRVSTKIQQLLNTLKVGPVKSTLKISHFL